MEVKAVYKYARISAKKMRGVARAVQGLSVSHATDILRHTPKKGAYLLNKTLKAAVANAENNNELSAEELVLKSVTVDEGPTQRRTMPRARGSANMIRKRTSHITVILASEEKAKD
ncbi:MAG: 50S ribosomal protein L22 [Akkermansiaceae bacterium]|nr:50S ribosomal protein L22 [Akkermansiaceae bacterium]